MAYFLNNLQLADDFEAASTLGPFDDADTCTILVSGNPAAIQFHIGKGAGGRWTDEREFVAAAGSSSTNSFKVANVNGIKLKNYNAGDQAVISVVLFRTGVVYDTADPIFEAGSLSVGTITASGSVTPGQASVQVSHNGVAVGTEPILDFVDAGDQGWQIADDSVNQRVTIAPSGYTRGHQGGIAFPGGATQSSPTTVAHGLGATPAAVIVTIDIDDSVNLPSFNLSAQVRAVGATSFDVYVSTTDGTTPPSSGRAGVRWLAIA